MNQKDKFHQTWNQWIEGNRQALKSIGIPPEVYLDLEHWMDFLENGHLHWHGEDSTGFDFSQLSPAQMHRLLYLLETNNPFEPSNYPLPSYLRVRLGQTDK